MAKKKKSQINASVHPDTVAQIDEKADDAGDSRSGIIARILEKAFPPRPKQKKVEEATDK